MKITKRKTLLCYIFLSSFVLTAQNEFSSNSPIPVDSIGVHNRNFKLDGFYYEGGMKITPENDTIRDIAPMIFFKNGTVIPFDSFGSSSRTLRYKKGKKKCKLKPKQDFDTIIEFIKCFCEVVDMSNRDRYPIYSIDGNIIRIQYFRNGLFYERQGIIVNDSTFVHMKSIHYLKKVINYNKSVYRFQQSVKPDSTNIKIYDDIKHYFNEQ